MKKLLLLFILALCLTMPTGLHKVFAEETTSADSTIEVETTETEDSTFTSFLNTICEFLNQPVFNSELKAWQLILIIVGAVVIINILIFK